MKRENRALDPLPSSSLELSNKLYVVSHKHKKMSASQRAVVKWDTLIAYAETNSKIPDSTITHHFCSLCREFFWSECSGCPLKTRNKNPKCVDRTDAKFMEAAWRHEDITVWIKYAKAFRAWMIKILKRKGHKV